MSDSGPGLSVISSATTILVTVSATVSLLTGPNLALHELNLAFQENPAKRICTRTSTLRGLLSGPNSASPLSILSSMASQSEQVCFCRDGSHAMNHVFINSSDCGSRLPLRSWGSYFTLSTHVRDAGCFSQHQKNMVLRRIPQVCSDLLLDRF